MREKAYFEDLRQWLHYSTRSIALVVNLYRFYEWLFFIFISFKEKKRQFTTFSYSSQKDAVTIKTHMPLLCSKPCESRPSVGVKVLVLSGPFRSLFTTCHSFTLPCSTFAPASGPCRSLCLEFSSSGRCVDQSLLCFRLLIICHPPKLST